MSTHAAQDPDSAVLPDSIDADTCRICRGEASPDEPLFYPCKCSGSIKFVHQDCLMEWLSHSHKKHCELCKTPFRFTKLYHPHMPKTLPTAVFIRRGALHFLSQVLFWCRGLLVFCVWLVLLPWTMRSVWRFMFWFTDSGWARTVQMEMGWPSLLSTSYPANYSTSTSSIKFASEESWRNSTSSQPLFFRMIRTFVIGATHSAPRELHFAMTANSTFNSTGHELIRRKHSSILSDATFLRYLTSSVTFNRSVMDVLEGIIITLSVVIAFVLIFLIREWVIQQQPVVNANPPPAENAPAEPEAPNGADAAPATEHNDQPVLENPAPDAPATSISNTEGIQAEIQNMQEAHALIGAADSQGDTASDESNVPTPSSSELARMEFDAHQPDLLHSSSSVPDRSGLSVFDSPGAVTSSRPDMPSRSRSSLATGIQRTLEETSQRTETQPENVSDDPLLEQARHITNGSMNISSEQVMSIGKHVGGKGEPSSSLKAATKSEKGKEPVSHPSTSRSSSSRSYKVQPPERIDSELAQHVIGSSSSDSRDITSGGIDANDSFVQPSSITESTNDDQTNLIHGISSSGPRVVSGRTGPVNTPVNGETNQVDDRPWTASLGNWFWGDIVTVDENEDDERHNEEHIVNDLADEEPFVPFEDAQPVIPNRAPQADEPAPRAVHDVNDVGNGNNENNDNANDNDVEAADDAEDLEGILELIGMQGPIVGLFQNAIFSTLLIAATIVGTVQLPYMLGRIQLVFLGQIDLMWHIPLHLLSVTADFLADLLLFLGGYLWFFTTKLLGSFLDLSNYGWGTTDIVAGRAGTRLAQSLYAVSSIYEPSATLAFSMLSHASLQRIQQNGAAALSFGSKIFYQIIIGSLQVIKTGRLDFTSFIPTGVMDYAQSNAKAVNHVLKILFTTGTISIPMRHKALDISDPFLAYWNGRDRLAAVLVGYGTVIFWAAIYVAYFAPMSSTRQYRRLEMAFVEVVQQAGGVSKVIFIISIEMILFPLFCGFLLDLALLPLFANSTINTRLMFTHAAPWTSGFVHWFVGTCYMFHFALFVSMCRKIMRTGVLYFIRDPDDPTFHPVRDVLERNVSVQLRKIAFSAIVYGTLITVCLGGVVWSLGASSKSILPIRWTSSESEREFPLDILFFNFLTPLVVKYAKPADGLHAMYKWWFHRCARSLRLSSFLFNEDHDDEKKPRSYLGNVLDTPATAQDGFSPQEEDTQSEEIIGRYARVPASDQIRIPKGSSVFVDVDKDNNRVDGKPEEGVHGKDSGLVTKVHIPPWFKLRIGLFVLAVWFFAAATGVSVTIVPLLFGRYVMSLWYSSPSQINDIYAFALGAYSLGGVVYLAVHARGLANSVGIRLSASPIRLATLRAMATLVKQVGAVIYVYTAFAIGLPILLAVLLELYILLPLHTYLGRSDTHIVHVVQDWTLGILYVRIFSHFAMAAPTSAPARIAATVLLDGYLRPNARIATRAFILPALLMFAVLATMPMVVASLINLISPAPYETQRHTLVRRLAYPTALGTVLTVLILRAILNATARWRQRIKDEVYLIGERLHNFNEKRQTKANVTNNVQETEDASSRGPSTIAVDGH